MVEYEDLKRMAIVLLSKEGQMPSKHQVEEAVDAVARIVPDFADREKLVREMESIFSITIPDGRMLSEDTGHVPWLDSRRAGLEWEFWRRYRSWLTDVRGWSPLVVNKIDTLTDQVLDKIEEPNRPGSWDRRGLVVGQVQSGKTSHYTGLICKAVDAGYKLIVVLAGVHNSLRSQTQLRLDEGFLGIDTQLERAWKKNTNKIGAGLMSSKHLHVAYLTNSSDKGDFKKGIARQIGIPLGSLPILLVVKKNSGVLRNLVAWLQTQGTTPDTPGAPYFSDLPILLLDDEADHASINTKETILGADGKPMEEQEATAINTRIRELLKMFGRSVYVGYTATPFANVFIHPHVNASQIGRDLFPRHFILNLPAPSNYIGPVQVFGLGEETDSELDQTGLPTTRIIDDFEDDFPQQHRKDHVPSGLPPSLREALLVFVLSCAARAQRGQGGEHNSMLVHITRFVNVQTQLAALIENELVSARNRILFGDGGRTEQILDELERLWTGDLMPTTSAVCQLLDDPAIRLASWKEVQHFLREAVARIRVKTINGTAQDVLDYFGSTEPLSIVAIGGDKLSRGLTLEGLTVSYYLRASRMYDTLMQMGRWFGYRPGYADLCRLYTTEELVGWYRHITVASEELRRDFDEMVRVGRTPEDFGIKVRAHPGGLIVTGAGKLRNYTEMRVSFSDRLIESYRISSARTDQQGNFLALAHLISGLGSPEKTAPHYIWSKVPYLTVTTFLRDLTGYPSAFDFAPGRLADFIDKLVDVGELTEWSVVLVNITKNESKVVAGLSVGYSERTPESADAGQLQIRRRHIISMAHEWLDIEPQEKKEAERLWMQQNGTELPVPNPMPGRLARRVRGVQRGLILLYLLDPSKAGVPEEHRDMPFVGYALSFPASERGEEQAVSYLVNSIYAEEEFDED